MDPGIIAAASALTGVIVAQVFALLQQRILRRHEAAELRRAKLEELADQLQQVQQWLDAWYRAAEAGGQSRAALRPATQARRVYVLALIYFPSLREAAYTLLGATDRLYAALLDERPDSTHILAAVESIVSSRKALDDLIAHQARRL